MSGKKQPTHAQLLNRLRVSMHNTVKHLLWTAEQLAESSETYGLLNYHRRVQQVDSVEKVMLATIKHLHECCPEAITNVLAENEELFKGEIRRLGMEEIMGYVFEKVPTQATKTHK